MNSNHCRVLAGSCLCGTVRYAVADEFAYAAMCHCSNCRRATGSAFKPFAGITRQALRLTQGEDHTLVFGDDINYDLHCKECGSLLYSVVRDGSFVHVAMGTLVDTPSIQPTQGRRFARSEHDDDHAKEVQPKPHRTHPGRLEAGRARQRLNGGARNSSAYPAAAGSNLVDTQGSS